MSGPEELRALVEATGGLLDAVDSHNSANGRIMVDPHATEAARAALTRAESSLASPAGMEGWTRAVRDVFEIELKINRAEPMEAMERALAAASVEFAAPHGEAK